MADNENNVNNVNNVITISVNSTGNSNSKLSEYIGENLTSTADEIIVDKNNIKIYFGSFYVEIILTRYSVRVSFVKSSSLLKVSKVGYNYNVINDINVEKFNTAIEAYTFIMTDEDFLQGLVNEYIGLSVSQNDKIDTLLRKISEEGADVQGLINEFYGIDESQNEPETPEPNPEDDIEQFIVTVAIDPENGGTVDGLNDTGTYQNDDTVTLTATAAEGYSFVNWKINNEEVGTDLTYTFTINNDVDITAVFTAQ